MALVDEASAILVAAGVGGVPGSAATWWIWKRELQATPDTAIAVVPTGGHQQENTSQLNRQTFQVLIRTAKDSSTGLEAKVKAVDDALNLYTGTVSGVEWVDTQKQGDELYLGRDANQRPMYSLNYLVFRERTT
jgi:hypothetical protein